MYFFTKPTVEYDTVTTTELVERFGAKKLDQIMLHHGDTLAAAYTDHERCFSEVLHAPRVEGYRASDIVIATSRRFGRPALVGFLQPIINPLGLALIDMIPEDLKEQAFLSGFRSTNLSFGPMVVIKRERGNGIATNLLRRCIGEYFPTKIRQMRENIDGYIIPEDKSIYGEMAPLMVLRSLERPLFLVESEHPRLLGRMARVVDEFPELYKEDNGMDEIELAFKDVLTGPMLSGNFFHQLEGNQLKLMTQLRLPALDERVVNLRTFLTTHFNQEMRATITTGLQRLADKSAINSETGDLNFFMSRVSKQQRDQILLEYKNIVESFGVNPQIAMETVYRAVVGTKF